MSRATAAVLFDDGTVKWCLYNGTSDVLVPLLFDTPQEPWNAYYEEDYDKRLDLWTEEIVGEPRHVVICTDYGLGFYWEGTAADNRVIGPVDIFNGEIEETKGLPDWFNEAYAKFRR